MNQPTKPPPPAVQTRSSPWKIVLGFGVVAALAFGAYEARNLFAGVRGGGAEKGFGKKGPQTIPVVVAKARVGDLPIYLDCLGTVTAFNTATIRSRVDGELVGLHFDEGQVVKAGDLLCEIDPRPYEVQLAQAEGNLNRDQATLDNAKRNVERDRPLRQTNVISASEYEASETAVSQTEGSVSADKAQVANAKLNLTYCKITAPFAGRVGLRKVDLGNYIRASDPQGLLVLVQTRPIAVVFTIPQDAVAKVRRQQAKEPLKVEIHGREQGEPLALGVVSAVDNQIDQSSGTVRLKATVPNDDEILFPNEFVSVRLLVETRSRVVIIPSAAVRHGPDSDFVYIVKDDSTVDLRPIKLGVMEGELALIESGVADGETVVTQGIDKLQPGAKVETRDNSKTGKGTEGKARRGKATSIGRKPGDSKAGSEKPAPEPSPGDKSSGEKTGAESPPPEKTPAAPPGAPTSKEPRGKRGGGPAP